MLFRKQLTEEMCLIMACLRAALIFLCSLIFPQHACEHTFHFVPILNRKVVGSFTLIIDVGYASARQFKRPCSFAFYTARITHGATEQQIVMKV